MQACHIPPLTPIIYNPSQTNILFVFLKYVLNAHIEFKQDMNDCHVATCMVKCAFPHH